MARGLSLIAKIVCLTGLCGCEFPRPADVPDDSGLGASSDGGGIDSDIIDASVAAPTITAVVPDWGSTAGGTRITLTGSGFLGSQLIVKFGMTPGPQPTIVSDTELVVTSPPGPHQPATVAVTTDGGTASSPVKFRYLAPLYAADGRGTKPGNLYVVDPASVTSTFVGPLSAAMTGLAFSTDGILFGATAAPGGGSLVVIDPYTAKMTTIGPLVNAANAAASTPDLAFDGARLLGWSGASLTTIDPATGRVTPFPAQSRRDGMGMASAAPGVILLSNGPSIATVNTANGVVTPGPALSSHISMDSLTFVGGTLYGSETTTTNPNTTTLVVINPTTGVATSIGALPQNIDAIAGLPTTAPRLALNLTATGSLAHVNHLEQEPAEPSLLIGERQVLLHELLALGGREVTQGGRVRQVVPVSALRLFASRDCVTLVSATGATKEVSLASPGLALVTNNRQELKLVDTREGFHRILANIVEVRSFAVPSRFPPGGEPGSLIRMTRTCNTPGASGSR